MNKESEKKLKAMPDKLRGKDDVLAIMEATIQEYEKKNLLADVILWDKLKGEIDRLWK